MHWERIADFICTESPTTVLDPDAWRLERRFYRVTLLTQPAELRLGLAADTNTLELVLEGPLGRYYSIEPSADLLDWQLVSHIDLTRSPTRFRDPSAADSSVRFYRAVVP